MAAGLVGADDYTNRLHWSEPQERDGTAREVVDAVVAELEDRYPEVDWRSTAAALKEPG